MKKILGLVLLLFLGIGCSVSRPEKTPMDPAVRYGKLENGMTYYIRHNEEPKNRASFYIAQNVGAILENDKENGLAHFLEHMAFNGTKHFVGKGVFEFLERHGVSSGHNINAYTAQDETVYHLSNIPAVNEGLIDSCLLVLHDWSNYLLLTEEEIDAERGVITEEWRTRRTSQFRVNAKQNKALLAGSKYLERDVIGSLDVIQHHDYETLRGFYYKWYRTDLQAIVVVGDLDVDKIEAKIKALFSKIPAVKNPPKREYFGIPDHDEPNYALATDKESSSFAINILTKYDGVAKEDKDKGYMEGVYRTALFNQMLGGRIAERMQQPSPPFMGLQVQLGGFFADKNLAALVIAHKEGGWEEAVRGAASLVEKVRRYGFTQEELDRAKVSFLSKMEHAAKREGKKTHDAYAKECVAHYLKNNPMPGTEYLVGLAKDLMSHLELEEFQAMAQHLMDEKNMTIVVNGPEKEGVHYPTKEEILKVVNEVKSGKVEAYNYSFVDRPFIAIEPEAGKIIEREQIKVDDLEATELTLSNGIRVLYRHSDIDKATVLFNAHSWGGCSLLENNELINYAFFSSFIGSYGLGDFSASELQKKLTGKIAGCGFNIGALSETMYGSASPKDMETMFQLLYLYFTNPRFDLEQYKILYPRVSQFLENIGNDAERAFKDSVTLILSNRHPRVQPITKESINGVSFEGIKQIYLERYANPGDFVFSFSGNFEEDKLESLIEKYVASLPTSGVKENYRDNGLRFPKKDINNYFERELGTTKSKVYVALHNDNYKFCPENNIYASVISQLLSKRYHEEIREKEGGTYGVSVDVNYEKRPINQFNLSLIFECDPKNVDKLKGMALDEIERLINGKVVEKDLNEIKSNILKGYEEAITKLDYWHEKLTAYAIEGELGMNNKDYKNFIKSINAKEITAKAKEFLKDAVKAEVVMSSEQ